MAPAESTVIETTEKESADQPGRPSLLRRLKTPRTALTQVLALALVAAVAAWGFAVYSENRDGALRREALDTAREYSIIMSSFDYQDLDANKDSIAAMSTDEFAGTYRTMVDSLRDVVAGGQGQASATAAHVGIESMDSSSATVLVFVDQEAKNVAAPQGNAQKYRMVISMIRSNDQWLVSNVETK